MFESDNVNDFETIWHFLMQYYLNEVAFVLLATATWSLLQTDKKAFDALLGLLSVSWNDNKNTYSANLTD